jgi:hypothetical protein
MRRVSSCAITAATVAAASAVLAIASPPLAGASTACSARTNHPFPSASSLRASHTSCRTARSVVGYIQGVWQVSYTLPGWFKAPSNGPRWHCRYQPHEVSRKRYTSVRCASGQMLVTLTLGA